MTTGKLRLIELALAGVILGSGCARTPEQKNARFLASGKKLMEKGDYRRAVLDFSNAVQAKPTDAESHYQLAIAFVKNGQPQEGVLELRRATELNPKHSAAQLKLAEMMVMTRNPDLARNACMKSCANDRTTAMRISPWPRLNCCRESRKTRTSSVRGR